MVSKITTTNKAVYSTYIPKLLRTSWRHSSNWRRDNKGLIRRTAFTIIPFSYWNVLWGFYFWYHYTCLLWTR